MSFAAEGAMPADALGVIHAPAQPSSKIACLVPSLTELLLDLGLREQLVARTGFCIHPANLVQGIAKVGGTKDVQLKKLRALAPEYVVLDMDENTKPVAEALREFVPQQVVTHPSTLRDNFRLFDLFGQLFAATPGVLQRAHSFRQQLEAQLGDYKISPPSARVLYLIWQDPWMCVTPTTYIADVLGYAGATVIGPRATGSNLARYPAFTLDQIDWHQCDAVLLSSEPYSFKQKHAIALKAQIHALTGMHLPCMLVDGELLSWYGSRSLKTLRYCADLQKLLNDAKHRG